MNLISSSNLILRGGTDNYPVPPSSQQLLLLPKRQIILSKEDEKRWIEPNLTRDQINDLLKPYPESDMIANTVSQNVNSGKNNRNVPQSQEKVDYPELSSL